MFNLVDRIDNFWALARKLSFLPTKLDIFDIRQHYVRIFTTSKNKIIFIIAPGNNLGKGEYASNQHIFVFQKYFLPYQKYIQSFASL